MDADANEYAAGYQAAMNRVIERANWTELQPVQDMGGLLDRYDLAEVRSG